MIIITVNQISYEAELQQTEGSNYFYNLILKNTENGKQFRIEKAIQAHQFVVPAPSKESLLESFKKQIEEHLNKPGKWEANVKEIVK
jgi:hypothetical protein